MRTTTSSERHAYVGRSGSRLPPIRRDGRRRRGGVTLIVGCRPDPRLGPLVVIGLGASARNFDTVRSIREVLLTWMRQHSGWA